MFISEFIYYKRHINPIKKGFDETHPQFETLELAFISAHRFPILTVKRVLGPHLFGLSIPASLLTFLLIRQGYLPIPYYFIYLAWFGAVLIAVMHALIEYFLTYRSVQPVITYFIRESKQLYNQTLELPAKDLVSIKKKLLISSVFIAVFPVLLFTLASNVLLNQSDVSNVDNYWNWAILILAIILFLAIFSSLLLYENIKKPIESLKLSITDVKEGHLITIENTYSDEFSHLITGFNHMIEGIKLRDSKNEALLESFYTIFAATLDARDPYTAGHSIRVAEYAVKIAEAEGLSPDQINLLHKSSLLHDIGKIGIRDNVLLKEGRLTDEEFEQIKLHPVIGANILEQINLPDDLKPLLPGVRYHHERYDGKGYPEGLRGEGIPLFGRIMAIADAYDAMTSDRPYRKGMPLKKALTIIEGGKGTQWDPHLASLFIEIMSTLEQKQIS